MRDVRQYLHDLRVEITAVEQFSADGEAAFLRDERTQYAVMMAYARIGEIVKRIPESLLMTQPLVAWKEIKRFRDMLMHRYFDIKIVRVWEAVEQLPALRVAVEALLAELPPDEEPE